MCLLSSHVILQSTKSQGMPLLLFFGLLVSPVCSVRTKHCRLDCCKHRGSVPHCVYRLLVMSRLKRAKQDALSHFSWFPKRKKPLHIGSHTRVGCLERLSLFVCVCVYVLQVDILFSPRLSTALNVHGTKASTDGSRGQHLVVQSQIITDHSSLVVPA